MLKFPDSFNLRHLDGFTVLALAVFGAWWQEDSPSQLVWGYWICGLVQALVLSFSQAMGRIVFQRGTWWKVLGELFFLGLVIGMFVFVYDYFGGALDLAYPLLSDPDRTYIGNLIWKVSRPFEFWPSAFFAAKEYAWMIALFLWSERRLTLNLLKGMDGNSPKTKVKDFVTARLFLLVLALIGLQILMQIIFGDHGPDLNGFGYAALVQIAAYYPLPPPADRNLSKE